jgi:hypothetical protein
MMVLVEWLNIYNAVKQVCYKILVVDAVVGFFLKSNFIPTK